MSMLYFRLFISAPGHRLSRVLAILLVLTALAAYFPSGPTPAGPTSATIASDFGELPMSFVPNAGQTDPAVRFQAQSTGSTLFFTPNEVVLSLVTHDQRRRTNDQSPETLHRRPSFVVGHSSVMRLRFEGTNPAPELIGVDRLPGAVNYFIGNDPSRWHTNLPTYAGIIYRELYPGIDLRYEGTTGTADQASLLKGTYTVAPGADPTHIRWHYSGAASVRLDQATGNLLIELPSSNTISQLIERAPVAWQSINGRRLPVSVRYAVTANGSIGFVLGRYDSAYPLILDPALTYSTYLGGSGYDYGYDIALDADGNAYVVGYTNSVDFPTVNPAQPDFGGGMGAGDVFVVKLNPTGSNLVYATYLGGRGNDRGLAIALDADGNAYVTGDTTSIDFPTQNPVQPETGGGGPFEGDAFVAKLDATGSALVYATYLGGIGDEIGYGIALDADGNAHVAGYTSSINFPIANAVQPKPAFPEGLNVLGDAFVTTVISASGVYTWGYSTYLGGTDWDEAHGIAVDAFGNAFVTGNTRSTNFPTMKPVQPDFGGGSFSRGDGFVTQIINASGVYTWGYSTYLGGTGSDTGYAIALDDSGDAYVTGETASTDFPTANPFQAANAGEQDAFVTKVISASGVYTWGYSTYLGGDGTDIGRDITVDAD
ncbi:MAG: SBBP repeat-containing protein [Anaerolineae bacterium]